jgi:hypothetical protein
MADAKQVRNATAAGIKKFKAHTQTVGSRLDALGKAAKEHDAAVEKLQSAAKRIKPGSDKKTKIEDNAELRKTLESLRLAQASAQYEKLRAEVSDHLAPGGHQRKMLSNLCAMLNICVEQHTGGKAGDAFDSRRDMRLIHMALTRLRDAGTQHDEAGKAMKKLPASPKPISDKTPISDISDYAKDTRTASAGVDDVTQAYQAFALSVNDGAEQALQGFAEADGAASA